MLSGYAGKERRKWGVENSGIRLLVTWVIEIIQQSYGDSSSPEDIENN